MKTAAVLFFLFLAHVGVTQNYPQQYFRNPLAIPMQLVANFGELRANHWHMGLDIRTQQRENLPVYAAAEGFVSAISIDATGFGRALYITHPNGFTTVYGHLNAFAPALNAWLKGEQYSAQSWAGKWSVPEGLFPVAKGDFIAYSGNTGGSQGPHVHFEIRDTKTDKCLNPLLFNFPIPDAVPPTLQRLALYDRNQNIYAQTPKLLSVKKEGSRYALSTPVVKTASNRISFAIGAIDRFTGSGNGNGIYSAALWADGVLQARFRLDSISYDETRYLNAQIDYRYKAAGGPYLQHLSQLPGERSGVYTATASNGVVVLTDTLLHALLLEIADAAGNKSILQFNVQYVPNFFKTPYTPAAAQLRPAEVNVFEKPGFELYTSEAAVYDTVNISYAEKNATTTSALSPAFVFLDAGIPTHDSITVRLAVNGVTEDEKMRLVITSTAGEKTVVQKGTWCRGWVCARFRQFGAFQVFVDTTAPTVNAPGAGDTVNLQRASRLVFNAKDNFKKIKTFRAELDGQWLLFSNDKNLSYIYQFDTYFTPGVHQLHVTVEDVAGNKTEKTWWVRR